MHKWISCLFGNARTHRLSDAEKKVMDDSLQEMVQNFPVREHASDCLNTSMNIDSSVFGPGKKAHLSSEEKVTMETEMFSFMRTHPLRRTKPKQWWLSFPVYTPVVALLILAVLNKDLIMSAPTTDLPSAQLLITDDVLIGSTSSQSDSQVSSQVTSADSTEEQKQVEPETNTVHLIPRPAPSMMDSSQNVEYENEFEEHEITDTTQVGNAIIHFTEGPEGAQQSSTSDATTGRTALDIPEKTESNTNKAGNPEGNSEELTIIQDPKNSVDDGTFEIQPNPNEGDFYQEIELGEGDTLDASPVGNVEVPVYDAITPVSFTLSPAHTAVGVSIQSSFAITFVTDISVQQSQATLYQENGTLVETITIPSADIAAGQSLSFSFTKPLQEGLKYYITIPASLADGFTGIGAQEWEFTATIIQNIQTEE